jgi:hypothetical protein
LNVRLDHCHGITRPAALSVPVTNAPFNFQQKINALLVGEMSQVADKVGDRVFVARTRKHLECPQCLFGEFDMLSRIHRFAVLIDRQSGFFPLGLGRKYDALTCAAEYWRQSSTITLPEGSPETTKWLLGFLT